MEFGGIDRNSICSPFADLNSYIFLAILVYPYEIRYTY